MPNPLILRFLLTAAGKAFAKKHGMKKAQEEARKRAATKPSRTKTPAKTTGKGTTKKSIKAGSPKGEAQILRKIEGLLSGPRRSQVPMFLARMGPQKAQTLRKIESLLYGSAGKNLTKEISKRSHLYNKGAKKKLEGMVQDKHPIARKSIKKPTKHKRGGPVQIRKRKSR